MGTTSTCRRLENGRLTTTLFPHTSLWKTGGIAGRQQPGLNQHSLKDTSTSINLGTEGVKTDDPPVHVGTRLDSLDSKDSLDEQQPTQDLHSSEDTTSSNTCLDTEEEETEDLPVHSTLLQLTQQQRELPAGWTGDPPAWTTVQAQANRPRLVTMSIWITITPTLSPT